MPQSLSQVFTHIIFSTKNREPLIPNDIRDELHAYMATVMDNLDSRILTIGSVKDHVHILCALSKNHTIKDVVGRVKSNSSRWIKSKSPAHREFQWQVGYAVFSVSASRVSAVRGYIEEQHEHHRKVSFKEELLRFLKEYGVEYDERYLWE